MTDKITVTFEKQEQQELLEDGRVVDVRVEDAEFAVSRAGNDSIRLKVKAMSDDGKVLRTITDYLTFTENAMWRVNLALESLGMASTNGQKVEITEESLRGKSGRVRVGVDSYHDRNGEEQQTNRIAAWLPALVTAPY